MFADAMDDLEIKLRVEREADLRDDARSNPNSDPSLYTPWGIMRLEDYPERLVKTDSPR